MKNNKINLLQTKLKLMAFKDLSLTILANEKGFIVREAKKTVDSKYIYLEVCNIETKILQEAFPNIFNKIQENHQLVLSYSKKEKKYLCTLIDIKTKSIINESKSKYLDISLIILDTMYQQEVKMTDNNLSMVKNN